MNNNIYLLKLQDLSLPNKYTVWYQSIINNALHRATSKKEATIKCGYVECHHIMPKSFNLGGIKDKLNLVYLTPREHYICHRLLTKMVVGIHKKKMLAAIWRMSNGMTRTMPFVNSSTYAILRNNYIQSKIGTKTGRTSKDFTPEWREKISLSRKGKSSWNKGICRTNEERTKMSITRKLKAGTEGWNIRPPCSSEKAEKIRQANTGKKWVHNPLNPIDRKQLNLEDCNYYIGIGWLYGTGPKTPRIDKGIPTRKHWWTNGVTAIQSINCPGHDYIRGRRIG